ncbi:MAG: class I SAM-dependent methyltransferase [Planctomycetota bacterium]|jgi:16S rRNA (guanine1516-N2)-methyltransferase
MAVLHDAEDTGMASAAASLAKDLRLPLVDSTDQMAADVALILRFRKRRLEIVERGAGTPGPICVDFTTSSSRHRAEAQQGRRQPLAAAIGLKSGCRSVFDATTGFGQDAFQLAALGCDVTACERSPVLAALLADGLARARGYGEEWLTMVASRVKLVVGDSRDVLGGLAAKDKPDTVFLDPMYFPRKHHVAVNKRMRMSRILVGDDADAVELFEAARGAAGRRVVVKRHPRAPWLTDQPSHSHTGKLVRYDVYLM